MANVIKTEIEEDGTKFTYFDDGTVEFDLEIQDQELYNNIVKAAAILGIEPSEYIVKALEEYVKKHEEENQ